MHHSKFDMSMKGFGLTEDNSSFLFASPSILLFMLTCAYRGFVVITNLLSAPQKLRGSVELHKLFCSYIRTKRAQLQRHSVFGELFWFCCC